MQAILKALSWTFFHSLWQGLLAAILAAVIITATRKASARLRYNLLGTVMILFLIATLITFKTTLHIQEQNTPVASALNVTATGNGFISPADQYISAASATGLRENLINWFNQNAELLMLAWTIFFLLNCLKLFTGLATVRRLRHYKTFTVSTEWKEKLLQLQTRLGIRQSVEFLQSGLVKVPMALGILKPVILVPIGLLANIPAEQAEAILLHELAHIRRKDYLVNLLQRFTDAVFFFNPAFLWVSSLVRQERETCCDDMVVANTGQKRNYVDALVAFQSYSLNNSSPAMAIGSKPHYLLNRVKRIMTNENKRLDLIEKIALLAGVIIFSAFTIIKGRAEQKENNEPGLQPVKTQIVAQQLPGTKTASASLNTITKKEDRKNNKPQSRSIDTTPVKKQEPAQINISKEIEIRIMSVATIENNGIKQQSIDATDKDGNSYNVKRETGKFTHLTVNGKYIPDEQLGDWSVLLNQLYAAGENFRGATGKGFKPATTEKQDEDNFKRSLGEVVKLKYDIGAKKKVIDMNKEKMMNDPNLSEKQKEELKDQMQKVQKEIESKRDELQKKRTETENYREQLNENRKERIDEVEKSPRIKSPGIKSESSELFTHPTKVNLFAKKTDLKTDFNQKIKANVDANLEKKKLFLNDNIKTKLKKPVDLKLKQQPTDLVPSKKQPAEPTKQESPPLKKPHPPKEVQ